MCVCVKDREGERESKRECVCIFSLEVNFFLFLPNKERLKVVIQMEGEKERRMKG